MAKKKGDRVHLLELRVRNVKRIKEVEIDFGSGDVHEIRGDAGQGKTTILESIEGALRGLDPAMVRQGESAAEIELHLSNAVLNRIVGADGTETLMVKDASGKPIEKAKDFLKAICGPSVFRPVAWVQLGRGEPKGRTERLRLQRQQLLEALDLSLTAEQIDDEVERLGEEYVAALDEVNLDGVDFEQHPFSVCSAMEKACYEFRKLQNSRAEDAEEKLRNTPAAEGSAPSATLKECEAEEKAATTAYHRGEARMSSLGELAKRREDLAARIEKDAKELPKRVDLDKTAKTYIAEQEGLAEAVEALEAQIRELQNTLNDTRQKLGVVNSKCDKAERLYEQIEAHEARKADLAELNNELAGKGEVVDLDKLKKEMERARGRTTARRLQDAHESAAATATAARARAEIFTGLVDLFRDRLPKRLLESADLPVKNLSVSDEQILIDGKPLHQEGTSNQIRIGILIAAALNPRTGFVLVDGAESLGRDDRIALAEVAREMDLQLIMTYVDLEAQPGEGVTVMREGEKVA